MYHLKVFLTLYILSKACFSLQGHRDVYPIFSLQVLKSRIQLNFIFIYGLGYAYIHYYYIYVYICIYTYLYSV